MPALRGWKRRYFRLKPRSLYYAKDSKSVIYEEIALSGVSVAEWQVTRGFLATLAKLPGALLGVAGRGGSLGGCPSPHAFTVITPLRQLVLCADSRRHMEEWISALKGVSSSKEFIEDVPPPSAPPRHEIQLQNSITDIAMDEESLPPPPDLSLQGQHSWYVTSHARPTYCNVCREALSGVTFHGLSCEVCKFRAHKRCASKSPNNCKWTTLASVGSEVLEDEEGSPSMPHQWVEGNLPVSSRCWSCERACGSVLRLQDWRCLWCRATVHTACRPVFSLRCPLGLCRVSVIPPVSIHTPSSRTGTGGGWWRGVKPPGCSPLLVFVNSKSGDNQGIKFLRRFKQLLNPAQVFDLMAPNGGPLLGLRLFSAFHTFRILVCGGDGSVSWVLSEIDRLKLHKQCQIGVLPLGTGNDLARVLGWGSVCDDDSQLPQLLEKYERATTKLLDRWSILTYEGPLPMPRKLSQPYSSVGAGQQQQKDGNNEKLLGQKQGGQDQGKRRTQQEPIGAKQTGAEPQQAQIIQAEWDQSISRLEGSVVDHLSKILESDQHCVVISSARVLCETVRDFILKVQSRTECEEIEAKCSVLNDKLDSLLKSLHEEELAHQAIDSRPASQSNVGMMTAVANVAATSVGVPGPSQVHQRVLPSPNVSPSRSPQSNYNNNKNNNNSSINNNNLSNSSGNSSANRNVVSAGEAAVTIVGFTTSGNIASTARDGGRSPNVPPSVIPSKISGCTNLLQREALMCRANSLKKALRQIIEHTERAVDEQNALPDDWRRSADESGATAGGNTSSPLVPGSRRRHSKEGVAIPASRSESVSPVPVAGFPEKGGTDGLQRWQETRKQAEVADGSIVAARTSPASFSPLLGNKYNNSAAIAHDISLASEVFSATAIGGVDRERRGSNTSLSANITGLRRNRGAMAADTNVMQDRCERMATIPSAQSASSLEEATSVASASAGGAGGSSSSRPHTLPILETTPDSPQPARSTTTTMSDSEQPSPVGRSPTSDGSDPDNEGLVGTTPTYSLLQLSSPTASRRISSGSTLKHIGNIAIQLAAAPSLAAGGGSSPGGTGASSGGAGMLQIPSGGARSPDVDVDRRIFPIINPLASLPAWPNLAGESSLVGKALLANADALCAAASPLMDIDDMNMDCFQEKCVMNNYFGIGLDAKIALEFHNKREEHPEKCRSRTKNLMWYGVLGGRELLNKTYKNLEQRVHLECDGHRIALPSLQGIVVLNIPSYGGGSNFWGGSKEDDVFFAPAMDDKILEVVAVFGTVQMAASRVINLQHHRIAQCRSVRITITGTEGVPVQVDGEAWLQPPGCVCIQHKNRTQILCRNRQFESSLKSWNEKQRRPSSGSQCGSKTAPAGSNVIGTSSSSAQPPGKNNSSRQSPLEGAVASIAVSLGPSLSASGNPLDGFFTDNEVNQLSTFIEAASRLVKVIQTISESNPVVDNELWLAASQTSSLLERFFPSGLPAGVADNELGQLRQQLGELISSAKQLQLETKIFIQEKIEDICRLGYENEDALVSASGELERQLKRCLAIRALAHFYDVERLLPLNEEACGLPSQRDSSKRHLPHCGSLAFFRVRLRALKASCLAHSETVPLAKVDPTLSQVPLARCALVPSARSAPTTPDRSEHKSCTAGGPVGQLAALAAPVAEWSSREVLFWLESLHLAEYRDTFLKHDIQFFFIGVSGS
ncbi:diacylglycerol kinase delta-like isoform X2 [Varroa jacobsoni]|uniref:diacylglycerol kinase delta-like isoform X2 n=1 Tax=Varroa jacobsoni TaxID=62625 RepID=UPI000BF32E73|nr:diacylglycerol kinase delta-like isoform X2 [Varroa jacobsoni]